MDFPNLDSSFPTTSSSKHETTSIEPIQTITCLESKYFHQIRKIGVIADIQYCDKDDGPNFNGTEFRRYRESLNVTKRAAQSFQKEEVGAIIQLGDAIDGHGKDNFLKSFNDILTPILTIPPPKDIGFTPELLPPSIPRLDVMGNHELYCSSRKDLRTILHDYNHDKDMLSYSREIADGKWRLIVLDSYAVSILGFKEKEMTDNEMNKLNHAKSILEQNNPECLNRSSTAKIIPDEKQRYDHFNGGLGEAQLKWLENQLDEAWDKRQFVVLFSHIPISGFHGDEYLWISLHWDADEVLQLIKTKGSHVVACIGGHRHSFSHQSNDELDTFTHHLVIPSPLLASVGGNAHAIFEFSVHLNKESDIIENQSYKSATSTGEPMSQSQQKYYNAMENFKERMAPNTMQKTSCNDNKSIATITVHGFGSMPKVIDLSKPAPKEWYPNL